MSQVGDALDEVREELAGAAEEFMPDLCNLLPTPTKVDQGAGHTLQAATPITDVPCSHEQLSGGGVQFTENGTTVTKTHRLKLPFTSDTVSITRHYKIQVHARGLNREMFFEQPIIKEGSMSPILNVYAVLTDGHRKPGTL